jgi:alkanesulfonate monooxygenase SsuD/methylene tetrahydromethanopterin reductase-like flavin-dependent oxidoreductase (luciferase family)
MGNHAKAREHAMKLGFFTMPIHPLGKDWRQSLREDREAFVLADEAGYVEGLCGEHVTDQAENITSCAMFIATLASATKNIVLGTGTVNMPNIHPAAVAGQIAMLDHLLDGRFLFGISPGGLLSDAEVFGNLGQNRPEMFLEGIEMVLAIWAGEAPYNLEGKYWKVSTEKTIMREIGQGLIAKPLQRPHPPIVVTAVSPHSSSVSQAGARGWDAISANFLLPQWVKTHWPKFVEGCAVTGRIADPASWRVAKSLCVADDLATARRYATDPDSPYRQYYNSLFTKLKKNGRLILFKTHAEQPDDEITLDYVCEKLILWGTPDKVADDILAFREEVGDFGTLLYAGKDWADPALGRRSMILAAEQVMPRVNAGIGTRTAA